MKQKPTQKQPGRQAPKADARAGAKKSRARTFFLDPYLGRYGTWITVGLVAFLILVLFYDFILGNKYYLFKDIGSDSINISWPQMTLLSRYIKTEGFPLWSFSQGMGQNIMPAVCDPFIWIVLLCGSQHIAYGFIVMELTKMVLTAVFFYHFLKELRLSNAAMIVGTLLYTFSGFFIIGSGWGIFSAEACMFALLLLSFEKIYNNRGWILFPVPVTLILLVQPFDLYLYGLFLILYFLFRHFSSDPKNWRKFLEVSLKMAGLTLVGVLISTFFLVSTVQMLLDSPRVGGNSSYASKLSSSPVFGTSEMVPNATAIMRFFSNDLLGNGSSFRGWGNYLEAPMVYIGLLPLLLFPQVFLFLDRRRKIFYGIFLALFIIPLIFPYFRYAFWLFTGDYYRGYSIFISLILLLFSLEALHALGKAKRISITLLLITLAGLLGMLFFPFENIGEVLVRDLRTLVVFFLVTYTLLIIVISHSRYKNAGTVLLICTVIIEIGYVNSTSIQQRVVLTKAETLQRTGYNDYSMEASAYVKSIDKGFFRVNKDYSSGPAIHTSYNDAKMQDFYGTLSYASFNQKYYIRFLEEAGLIRKGEEFQSRWATGFGDRPFLQTFASVKYNFVKTNRSPYLTAGFDSLTQFNDVKVLKNRYALPLGFTYERYIPLKEFRRLSEFQKQLILFRAFVAEEPVDARFKKFTVLTSLDTAKVYTWNDMRSQVDSLKKDSLKITAFSDNRITGTIDLKAGKLLFFSIPYDRGWHSVIDGKPVEPVLCNVGFMGFYLDPGRHDVVLFYKPPWFSLSLVASLAGLALYALLAVWQYRQYRRRKSMTKTAKQN